MYVKQNSVSEVNFLASSKFQNFTRMVSDEGVTADEKGRKIVPAGTVYKNENGVAIGLLFHDVDVTNGPHEAAVMYQGIVIGARLPETVSAADKATMKGIMFKDEYEDREAYTYELSLTQGAGTTLSVTRDGVALADEAEIKAGDLLVITVASGTVTVNGEAFVSGGVHTVAGDVTVVSTAN